MKDPLDNLTGDLISKRGRGRPPKPNAKTRAQINADYRAKLKEQGFPTLAQALAGFEVWCLPKGCRKWRKFSGHDALSWEAAQATYRGAMACNDIDAPGIEEIGALYEVRCVLGV